jgi:hypothetical protein
VASPEDPSLRKLAVDRVLHEVVHTDGGPLIHSGSEEEQRSFDSTCRRLQRFLTYTGRADAARGKEELIKRRRVRISNSNQCGGSIECGQAGNRAAERSRNYGYGA